MAAKIKVIILKNSMLVEARVQGTAFNQFISYISDSSELHHHFVDKFYVFENCHLSIVAFKGKVEGHMAADLKEKDIHPPESSSTALRLGARCTRVSV